MSYKETSERIKEVIGGEIFNPWEHRRYLPAQFERSCIEDPDCTLPVCNIINWLNTEMQSLRKLMDSKHPRAREIFSDRVKFLPVKDLNPKAKYSFAECGDYLRCYDVMAGMVTKVKQRFFRFDIYVGDFFNDLINNPREVEFNFKQCLIKGGMHPDYAEKTVKSFFKSYHKMEEIVSIKKVMDFVNGNVIPLYVRAGVYYYRKSKGESVTTDEVLAMDWDDIIDYRESIGSEVNVPKDKDVSIKDVAAAGGAPRKMDLNMYSMDAFL